MEQTVKELHEKRSILYSSSIESHKKYMDEETGLFKDEFVEYRNCPVCNNNNDSKIFNTEGGTYVRCNDCGMVYANPVFKDSALNDYYKNNHTIQSEVVENDQEFYINIYTQGLNAITNEVNKKDKILDIGCSSGVFLDLAKKRGWNTFGVELNKNEYLFAQKKGHTVYNELLENINFDEKFNAITMWDVFEHLKDGEFYLNTMKNLLDDDGVIFLQVPSADSLAAKILQEKCNMFDGLEHVNLYGVETIKLLADKVGLKVLSMQTVISEIGVINNYLGYEDPYLGNTTNKENIPNIIDEKKLHENLQGYKIQVVLGVK